MDDQNPAPSPPPVTDRRPVPRGVMPRGFQTWLMGGLALGIVLIILADRSARAAQGADRDRRRPRRTEP